MKGQVVGGAPRTGSGCRRRHWRSAIAAVAGIAIWEAVSFTLIPHDVLYDGVLDMIGDTRARAILATVAMYDVPVVLVVLTIFGIPSKADGNVGP
jgi:hypothetical protein